jgi:FMN hydrolase / 5-amino-6-(5-phospho-D-ribitylamino)uracil phosphatase
MKKIKIVSVDMFGTLADTDSIRYHVWREFLKDKYTDQLVEKYWDRATEILYKYYETLAMDNERHYSVKNSFGLAYSEVFHEIGLDFDPYEAAHVLAGYHPLSTPYADATSFLNNVGKNYPVCLSSDTDDDMLGTLKDLFTFDHIFTSEQLRCYKANTGGHFFSVVIGHYQVKPEEIIHVGDGRLETVSAKKAGLVTCWLNRKGASWTHEIKPDYEVNSLFDLVPILEKLSS